MPPTDPHAADRVALEEALAWHNADAKAAAQEGNTLRWARRHEQIDQLLALWDTLEAEAIGGLRPTKVG
jgi:hypothetical protein